MKRALRAYLRIRYTAFGNFPGISPGPGWQSTFKFPQSFAVPYFRHHIPKRRLRINSIEDQKIVPVMPIRFVLPVPFAVIPDVERPSHFPLFMYTFSCPSFDLFPSHVSYRLGFGPFKYRHGGLVYIRNLCKLSCSSPCYASPPNPHSHCSAVANVEALRLQVEELKQRLTDLEELKERLVGALH